jgi:SAM-dependent methyltransferase
MTRHSSRILEEGTRAHYLDAAYYDQSYRRRTDDLAFYADLAEELGGPVLELGVGTGRVAVAIARRGIDVVGLDRMPSMLAQAGARLARQPVAVRERIELVRGDMRRLALGRRFSLVIAPFNGFMHLYERQDWERTLAGVRDHLTRSGRLAFDILLPDPTELARDPARMYRGRPVRVPNGPRYRYRESFDYDPVQQVQLVTMVFEREDDPEDCFVTPLTQRQIFPAELEMLLHYNGFSIEERDGDFQGAPLERASESQVVLARPHRRA